MDILAEDTVVSIIESGYRMMYKQDLGGIVGLFLPDKLEIYILRGMDRDEEDVTILHEWVHAAEDYHFDDAVSTEEQVEDMALRLYREQPDLVKYIRSFYEGEGFSS